MITASTQQKPGFFARLFNKRAPDMGSLYTAIVAVAREKDWYVACGVPDTIDGRFDMVTLVLSLVLLRLEDARCEIESVQLTERFVDDMDGQIRESGFGDLVVGKQIGGIMALLGGRLGAYRTGIDGETLVRTLWRGSPPDRQAVDATVAKIVRLRERLDAVPAAELLNGRLE